MHAMTLARLAAPSVNPFSSTFHIPHSDLAADNHTSQLPKAAPDGPRTPAPASRWPRVDAKPRMSVKES